MKYTTTVKVPFTNPEEKRLIKKHQHHVIKAFHLETDRIAGVQPLVNKVEFYRGYKTQLHFNVTYTNPRELNLYGEKDPCRVKPLLLPELKKYATFLGIAGAHTKKKETLIRLICEIKGYDQKKEKPEIIEYLIAGGSIKVLPPQDPTHIKPTNSKTVLPAKQKKSKRKRERKPRGEATAKVTPEGMVSLAQILEELGVSGRIARRRLRESDIKKPGTAWVWDKNHKDVKAVRELLK